MKRTVRLFSFACFVACSSLAAVDCGSSGGAAVLSDKVTIVEQSALDQVTVEQDRLIFPATGSEAILQKKPGDILAGDSSETNKGNPYGFLRKVKSVTKTDAGVVVETEDALITDAVQEGKFQVTLQTPALGPSGPEPLSATAPGLRPQGNGDPIKLLDFAGKTLLDKTATVDLGTDPPQSVSFHASAKTSKGQISFTPTWDIGADIGFFKVTEFHATATGDLKAEVEIDAQLDTSTTLDSDAVTKLIAKAITDKADTTLFEYPINLGKAHLGPLSIPISAKFKTTIACDFAYGGKAEVLIGANGNVKVTAGLKYENGTISPVFDHSEGFNVTGPNWTLGAAIKLRCDVRPTFDLQFYDKASAGISADAYASLYGSAQCDASKNLTGQVSGEAFAGANASVYAKADIFGLIKFDKSCTLFDIESPHAKGSASFPLPGGATGTCTTGDVAPPSTRTEPNPAACFGSDTVGTSGGGDTSSGSGAGSGGTSGSGGGTCGKHAVAPSTWTCAPEKYGDCTCDCGCGVQDDDCLAGQCSSCDHDECTVGNALGRDCSDCVKTICDNDPYCCEQEWGASCLLSVQMYCGKTCQ
jgi:hypothetical protein